SVVYGGRVEDAMVAGEARYVHLGDGDWWAPAGRRFYAADADASPAEELDEALRHFFLARRYHGPTHTPEVPAESAVAYDAYDLLVLETRDAVGNLTSVVTQDDDGRTSVGIDYRVLQPTALTDP